MDERPRKYPIVEWDDHWEPPPKSSWLTLISNAIFAGLLLTVVGWSWHEDKFALAMGFLAIGIAIRLFDRRES